MDYLTYTPSVEVYIDANVNGKHKYYDVSKDIVSATVSRVVDDASSFEITLANKNRKYNGLFSAMDRVAIYATKTDRHRLLTGYITDVDAFKLYSSDFSISGKCSLYQLQRMYWDPLLMASQYLTRVKQDSPWKDGGYWNSVYNMLTEVGGWSSKSIAIEADLPIEVLNWARDMYNAQAKDFEQTEAMFSTFDEILRVHGPTMASSGVSAVDASGTSSDSDGENTGASAGASSGGLKLSGNEANASAGQKKIAKLAVSGTVPGNYGWCLKWVGDVYEAAGYPFDRYWGAIDVWRNRKSHVSFSSSKKNIPLGASVVTTGNGSDGAGHIGIYIGDGKVISEVGGQRIETVDAFGSWAGDVIDGLQGWCGWVAPKCGVEWK